MPSVLKTTALAYVDPSGVPANNGPNGFDVPLEIGCPRLPSRPDGGAKSVKDLRPDDIKVVIGIGDSVMAGFGAKGLQNDRFVSMKTLNEDRGVSFAMGGDIGATTLPNLIHYYTPSLYGSSVGSQLFTICFGDEFCPKGQYKPDIGYLNAAQSGARSSNLDHEIDYLLEQLDDAYVSGTIKPQDWKLLTLFIGSNDICHSCTTPTSLPPPFIMNVAAAVDRVRLTIRNVFLQIVGVMRVDEIFVESQNYPEYCQPFPFSDFVLHDHECECAHTPANRTVMATLTPQYNVGLQTIADSYMANDSFAVTFQPLKTDILSFPIEAIR
ncbi:hypothetical protein BDB00DRAFT_767667 [Zychaea mexicana]|uniref:uncharacterized protein n=1 Tax=Zychaea mexicana TaxID=64656 RepID=UPI0022FEBC0A|nr:uncharacterized protein BDB00DRAFT_767667 [Zychaea mexicana]KAI9491110.1 hypothetical protein BDB00DRAFT_767667 [Zychaea mexicana]